MDPLATVVIGAIGFISIVWQVIVIKRQHPFEKIQETYDNLSSKQYAYNRYQHLITSRYQHERNWAIDLYRDATPLNTAELELFNKCSKILADRKIWQKYPKRVFFSVSFGILVIIGTILYHSYSFIVSGSETFDFFQATKMIGLSILFAIIFYLKSYFNPLVLGYFAGYSAYLYIVFDQVKITPVINMILGLIFTQVPEWLEYGYLVGFTVFSFIVSGMDISATKDFLDG